jgi:DNA mismatch endonuclease (patch repair protein)
MADVFTKQKRSEIMSKIRSKGTKPELEVFRYLRREKLYFQKHYKHAPGKPDIAVPSRKIAIFIDGDFWHGWRFSAWRNRIPKVYWREKIENNIRRDKKNFAKLRRKGWSVLRVWEHDLIKSKKEKTLKRIRDFLDVT